MLITIHADMLDFDFIAFDVASKMLIDHFCLTVPDKWPPALFTYTLPKVLMKFCFADCFLVWLLIDLLLWNVC